MRILIVSDTHIPVNADGLPEIIKQEAKRCACCIHAGDFIDQAVLEELSSLTKVYAVRGNMDNEEIKNKLPDKQILNIEGIKIGLFHGRGSPSRILETIDREFADQKDNVDIFIFGHSHYAFDREINGKIYFNPGSVTDTTFAPFRSYGILEINGSKIKRQIVKIG